MTNAGGSVAPRILIADDDPAIRTLFRKALRNAGYTVEVAADGDQALAAIEAGCPNVLLADLVMPGLTGDELARRVREHCPGTALIFMSGYSAERLHEMDIKQVVFLPKPIAPREVIDVIARLLRRRSGEPQTT